ncbi:hypothetical protein DFH09DRAFT_1074056 [Mycena vulgaris]|nr:hypothetical protein DFH09DRAFT_1074056 [Mycena vulgaris]
MCDFAIVVNVYTAPCSDFTRDANVADDGVTDMNPAIHFLFDFAGCFKYFAGPPDPHIAVFHRIAEVIYPKVKNIEGQFVMICIHKMVSTLNDCLAMANSVKVAQNLQTSRWPTSTKDIIPCGGKITTQMFLRWAHYTEDMAFMAFGILGHMVKICGTLIISDVAANAEVGEVFVSTGFRMCRDATKLLCHHPCDESRDYTDDLVAAAEFRQRATFVAVFLESATTLAPEIFTALIAGREAKMLDAQFETFDWAIFSRCARQILGDHPELQPLLGKLHWDIAQSQRTIEDPLDTVQRVLAAAKSRTRCHAPGCPQSLASTGQEFKHCSACRVAAYCGKACQTRAWKSGPHAHRRICAQITALVAKGGGLDDRASFVRNCREAQVSTEEALEVAKWEFNLGVTASGSGGLANADGADGFDELYWKLHPNRHPTADERWERTGSYWD